MVRFRTVAALSEPERRILSSYPQRLVSQDRNFLWSSHYTDEKDPFPLLPTTVLQPWVVVFCCCYSQTSRGHYLTYLQVGSNFWRNLSPLAVAKRHRTIPYWEMMHRKAKKINKKNSVIKINLD